MMRTYLILEACEAGNLVELVNEKLMESPSWSTIGGVAVTVYGYEDRDECTAGFYTYAQAMMLTT